MTYRVKDPEPDSNTYDNGSGARKVTDPASGTLKEWIFFKIEEDQQDH
jgi:hypothetical protein